MPQDNIEEIKNKVDVVDLIQEYIQLKPAGANNFKANCPFHQEKTPSFMVSRDKQIWHCFGCGEGGDIFGFVQRMEGIEFPEALRMLAKKAGVQLAYQDPGVQNQKTRLHDICKASAEFFHKILVDHPKAKHVRDYLEKRQINADTIDNWQIGFSPDAWDTLNTYLVKKGFKEEEIFLAGMTIKKDRGVGYNDRFRNRLMFPIADMHGSIIGFGGRWLGDDQAKVGKYINSPQTLIYNKSRVIYGLDKARQDIKSAKLAVIVEGYMDCIMSHQSGVTNVVASSGTALTPDQVKILKRYTLNLAFAFDQDIAGDTAARRGIEIVWQEEMNTKIIHISGANDPDELIKKDPKAWPDAIKQAQSIMEYYFDSTLKDTDLSKVDDKKEVAKVLLAVIAKLADPIEQTHYLQKLASLLKVEESILRDKVNMLQVNEGGQAKSKDVETKKVVKDRYASLSEEVVGTALVIPEVISNIAEDLKVEYIINDKLQRLYKMMIIYYTEKHIFNFEDFLNTSLSEDQELAAYANILNLKMSDNLQEVDEDLVQNEVNSWIKDLKKHYIKNQLKNIEEQLRNAEESDNKDDIEKYSNKFTAITAELKQVE